ncbi:hypothetical protein GM556_01165 [Bombella sp. ESL0378]|nr:hypothetical protein [Bombella sp. ESL0378]
MSSNRSNAMSNYQEEYPARYYASYDHSASQPTPVTGWFDMGFYNSLDGFPPASELLPLTPEQWENRLPCGQGVQDGKIVPYTPPPPPLKAQATSALQAARQIVYNNYGIIGEPTPDNWVAYIKALMAIVNGTDTTSKTLPTAPSEPTA